MDSAAFVLSLKLALATLLVLVPLALIGARALARWSSPARPWVEGLLALPLVLPPTVIGYYLLVAMGGHSPLGQWFEAVTGHTLAFSFTGLVVASVVFNIPFAVQPMQRAFEAIEPEVLEAAKCCGLSAWQSFVRIELPLAWPGVLSACVLTFVHTLGEFGVVLMVGGSIPGETKTIAISIYDRVQAFDLSSANQMALLLLLFSLGAVGASFFASARLAVRR